MESSPLLLSYNTSHKQFEKAEKGQGQGQRQGKNMGARDKIQLLREQECGRSKGSESQSCFPC